MKIILRLSLLVIFLSSCRGPEIWIPQGRPRAAVTMAHVQYLESPPQRAHIVIGIITQKLASTRHWPSSQSHSQEAAKTRRGRCLYRNANQEATGSFSIRPEGESL